MTTTEAPAKTAPLAPDTVKVGDGVTRHLWSDRHAGTVTWVSPSGKTFRWTRDNAKPNGPVHDREQYDYTYESTPVQTLADGSTNESTARWSSKRQRFVCDSTTMSAGRHEFYDPHF